jgi:5-methylcytosine-specific restriction endonuclease McrA
MKIFEAGKGTCHICEQTIHPGEKWDADHIIPLALGGKDGEAYMAPAHLSCHGMKTKADVAQIAKAKRQAAKHAGAKQSKWPRSKWKRRMDGTVVPR